MYLILHRLSAAKYEKGISIDEMWQQAGISDIDRRREIVLNGKEATEEEVQALASVLDVNPEDIAEN